MLRRAFASASKNAKSEAMVRAREALAEATRIRLDDLERTMQQAVTSDFDARGRLALEQVVARVSVDLDAAVELLDLSDRAEHAMETELSLDELARVSLRGGAYGTDKEIPIRLALPTGDCVLCADPHVFKRLVSFCIARVHAAGVPAVSLRARAGADSAQIEIGPTTVAEQALPIVPLRLIRRIEPTDAILQAAAEAAAIALTVTETTLVLEVPRIRQ